MITLAQRVWDIERADVAAAEVLMTFGHEIDAVLERERERRKPPPPPISAEHAALRERIVEELRAVEWNYDDLDWRGLPSCTLETVDHSIEALVLMREEKDLLAEHGMDYRFYDRYQLE